MTAYALLFTLAAIGLSETVYLIRKRMFAEKLVCLIGGSCNLVLESKYNKLFGVHNDILGLLFYVMALFISGFLVIGVEPLLFWIFILKFSVAVGSLMSLIFTYLQWRVIKAWCFWCLMSAITIWLMGAALLVVN
ncbi:MAG: vitamin K epoxide reductase family protein [Patescibacteria group bacterium]